MAREMEAAEWFAAMRGPDAEAHSEAFEIWRRYPANAAAYAKVEADWNLTSAMSRTRVEARAREMATRRRLWRWGVPALAAATLAGVVLWSGASPGSPTEHAAPGSAASIILADGSRVQLMDGARIAPRFDAQQRGVELFGGRARFEVAHDAARRFTVFAGHAETVALGTIFEVDARSMVPRVTLIAGSVAVRPRGGAAVRLKPGEIAKITPTRAVRVAAPAAGVPAPRWLDADAMPLAEIVARANAINAVPIALAEPELAALTISGRFDLGDGAALARKLAAALDLATEQRDDGVYLTRQKIPGG